MTRAELQALDYPRHLHQPGTAENIVDDYRAALSECQNGWSLDPVVRTWPAGTAVPALVLDAEPVAAPIEEDSKGKPKRGKA